MSNTPGADLLNGQTNGVPWPFRPVTMFRKVTAPFQRANGRAPGAGPDSGQPWHTTSTIDEQTCMAEDLSVVYVDPDDGKEYTLSDLLITNRIMLKQILAALKLKAK